MSSFSLPKQIKVVVGTPCYGGAVTVRYMQSMVVLMMEAPKKNISIDLKMIGYEFLITRGRNTLVARFLDQPDATHLFFVDADIAFELSQVLRMIAFDREVVAGMYPLKRIEWSTSAIDRVKGGEKMEQAGLSFVGMPLEGELAEKQQGFVTGKYAGTGFMLIKRQVLERMIAAYPKTHYTTAHTGSVPLNSPNQYALFDCVIDEESGAYLSEDFAFCKRWRALGGKIWLDTQSTLTHIGQHDFFGTPIPRFAD